MPAQKPRGGPAAHKLPRSTRRRRRIAGPEFDDDDGNGGTSVSGDTRGSESTDHDRNATTDDADADDADDAADADNDDDDNDDDDNDDADGSEGDDDSRHAQAGAGHGGSSMADTMARILGKSVKTEVAPILAHDSSKDVQIAKEKQERRLQREKRLDKRQRLERGHVGVNDTDLNHERVLRKLATRGVVLLFNAINKQQREHEKITTSAPEFKKDKVLKLSKDSFLDLIKNSASGVTPPSMATTSTQTAKNVNKKSTSKTAVAGKSTANAPWNVFTDDYLMGPGNLKGWDRPGTHGPLSSALDTIDEYETNVEEAAEREELMDS